MKKKDIIELEITDYAFEGKGIAKIQIGESESKFVIFVDKTYPGDVVKAEIQKKKKSYAEAVISEFVKKSEMRTAAKCRYFGVCGGCKQQDLSYEAQTGYKKKQTVENLEKIGAQDNFEIQDIVPSEDIFYYRNKMEYSFCDRRWLTSDEMLKDISEEDKNFALGLHIPKYYSKVLDVEECFLQSEISNRILNFTRSFFKNRNVTIYNNNSDSGYLRNLVIRQSYNRKDLMVNLVTSEYDEALTEEYTSRMMMEIPEITTVVNNINTKKALIAFGEYEKVIRGNGYIFDEIGEKVFRISANSFFQTNTKQAGKLYSAINEFAEPSENDIVYDLFSGAGTISIYISNKVKYVYGFESVTQAVRDAGVNSELNKSDNLRFFEADLNKSFLGKIRENNIPKPDIIITDPPRAGMNPNTISDILELNPRKIVYVSCNPATQARDIKLLTESGNYNLIKIRPVDMFPHTFHIENVALLIRK